ncbi:optic atrophy 3-like family protein [Cavenderia fasciculata]|uniref:Optic atrophy 3-like family protein n=1 Tax=Cavenderia fasciculata TaxID=261658 RepID=F4PUX7_CACFS|nr:optic atrophy 3-like family protein [Cavenderia fasciculata]EGG21939.1 optic atrophy 3-like family protein [Cavenderia fasciculata]|eukprot:XP_004359790.1 optic atrophy 3-like family protein [Cavenderia fasciculata]
MTTTTTISIIGTAGRDKTKRLTSDHFAYMCQCVESYIADKGLLLSSNQPSSLQKSTVTLVSGGAAWADHVAVDIYLRNPQLYNLVLYLPCPIVKVGGGDDGSSSSTTSSTKYQYLDTLSKDWRTNPGKTSNNYHNIMSKELGGRDTIKEIMDAHELGAILDTSSKGFHTRNTKVSKSDYLIAFTSSTSGQPEGGGTLDTWTKSKSLNKIHFTLQPLQQQQVSSSPPTIKKKKTEPKKRKEKEKEEDNDNDDDDDTSTVTTTTTTRKDCITIVLVVLLYIDRLSIHSKQQLIDRLIELKEGVERRLRMVLPLLKVGSLLVKSLAKPFSKQIKVVASKSPAFHTCVVSIARGFHKLGDVAKRNTELNVNSAIDLGSEMASEFFLLSVAVGLLLFENKRSAQKEHNKEEALNNRFKKLEEQSKQQQELIDSMVLENDQLRHKIRRTSGLNNNNNNNNDNVDKNDDGQDGSLLGVLPLRLNPYHSIVTTTQSSSGHSKSFTSSSDEEAGTGVNISKFLSHRGVILS